MHGWIQWPGLLLCLGLAAGCGKGPARPNVLLVTLDTTRADRLGCYGHAAADTPALDALAARGVRFEQAHAQAPLTLTSHASLLTGLYPREHGMHVNGGARLSSGIDTLAGRLREDGYRTGAFVSAFVLDGVFGLDRGFDHYDDTMGGAAASQGFESERPADRVVDAALEWLDGDPGRPFLAWVHFYDPHTPYRPPQPWRDRFADPYDGELAFVDAQFGRLVEWLESRGLADDTIVVVAGDHGESFGEHGEPEHGLLVYATTIHVPLIVAWTGHVPAGMTVPEPVALVDVYPTVLALAGAAATDASGSDLSPRFRGEAAAARPVYGESRYGQFGYGWAPLRFLIDGDFKYIEAPTAELYDIIRDPGETNDLIASDPARAAELRGALLAIERAHPPRGAEDVDLDGDALGRLRSLGYVGGGSSAAFDPDADTTGLRDPRSMLEPYRAHQRVGELLGDRQYTAVVELLLGLLAESPESYDVYADLGFAYLGLGRPVEAQRAYETSLTLLPEHAERLWGLGESLRRQQKYGDAIAAYEAALAQRPAFGEAHMALTAIYRRQGDFARALVHARRHVEINPGSALAWRNLCDVAMGAGDAGLAAEAAGNWIARDPRNVEAHEARWQAWLAANRTGDAIEALRASHAALPEDWNSLTTLAWLLAVTPGQPPSSVAEAIALAEQSVRMSPGHPRSHDVLGAALAASGDFAGAAAAAQRGVELAGQAGSAQMRAAIEARQQLYRSGRAYVR